jgi:glycosyltransferase involved in cell wall biosynthesis
MTARNQRVAHVVNAYGHVSETFIPDSIDAIERAGWEGWVFTRERHGRDVFTHPPDDRVIVAPDAASTTTTVTRLAGRGVAHDFAERVAPEVARAAPAVAHAHFGWSAPYGVEVARRAGAPAFVTFYGTDASVFREAPRGARLRGALRGRRANAYTELLPHIHKAIPVSNFLADGLRRHGFADDQIEVVHIGVKLDKFPYRAPRDAGPDEPVKLLFVGRLVPRKGADLAIRALARVAKEHDGVSLDLVGDGPSRPELERLADDLGLAERTSFLGAQPPAGVREAQESADIQLVPSRTLPSGEAEGSPTVTKEAQAVGLPLVATDNGGTIETIPPEHRADLVREDDPAALADRVLKLIEDRASWPARTELARRWVETEFDWDILAARLTHLYAEALR